MARYAIMSIVRWVECHIRASHLQFQYFDDYWYANHNIVYNTFMCFVIRVKPGRDEMLTVVSRKDLVFPFVLLVILFIVVVELQELETKEVHFCFCCPMRMLMFTSLLETRMLVQLKINVWWIVTIWSLKVNSDDNWKILHCVTSFSKLNVRLDGITGI